MAYDKQAAVTWTYRLHITVACIYAVAAVACLSLASSSKCNNYVQLQLIRYNATKTMNSPPFNVGFVFVLSLVVSVISSIVTAQYAADQLMRRCNMLFYDMVVTTPLMLSGTIVGIANITSVWAVIAVACMGSLSVTLLYNEKRSWLNCTLSALYQMVVCIFVIASMSTDTLPILLILAASVVIVLPVFRKIAMRVSKYDVDCKLRSLALFTSMSLFAKFLVAIMWGAHCVNVHNLKILATVAVIMWFLSFVAYACMVYTIPKCTSMASAPASAELIESDDESDNEDVVFTEGDTQQSSSMRVTANSVANLVDIPNRNENESLQLNQMRHGQA